MDFPKLILTADDFGVLHSVDKAIIDCASEGLINCVSTFCTFPFFDQRIKPLVHLLKKRKNLAIGVHLNLSVGRPLNEDELTLEYLCDTDKQFNPINELLFKLDRIPNRVIYRELKAQILRLQNLIGTVDHLSHHMNVMNLHPRLFYILCELASEFDLAVRNPLPMSMDSALFRGLPPTIKRAFKQFFSSIPYLAERPKPLKQIAKMTKPKLLQKKVAKKLIPTSSYFCDLFYGKMDVQLIDQIFSTITPNASVEVMTHPGYYESTEMIPNGIDVSYMPKRFKELSTLRSNEFKKLILDKYPLKAGFGHLSS